MKTPTHLRYPSLRNVKRVPNLNGGGADSPRYVDGFYVIGYGMHHGYGKRMRFLCSCWDYLNPAIESRDRYAAANPGYIVRVVHWAGDYNVPKPYDGVTLSIND